MAEEWEEKKTAFCCFPELHVTREASGATMCERICHRKVMSLSRPVPTCLNEEATSEADEGCSENRTAWATLAVLCNAFHDNTCVASGLTTAKTSQQRRNGMVAYCFCLFGCTLKTAGGVNRALLF